MRPDRLVFSVPATNTHVDRYLKWLPAVAVAASRQVGLKTAHDTRQQVALIALSTVFLKAATEGLKRSVYRSRPRFPLDGQSFPSSHTSTAVAGAELLRKELKDHYSLLAWSGYFPAVATAAFRLSKRRHWPSDILAGAVIGIGSVWLAKKIIERKRHQLTDPSHRLQRPDGGDRT